MPIDLYYMPVSAPCSSVILVAKALGVELNLKLVNLDAKEQFTAEFTKVCSVAQSMKTLSKPIILSNQLNPMQCIPVLCDDGFVLYESRAMLMYLVEKYGQDDALYPRDARERAIVNHRLFFDVSLLYQRFSDYFYPQIFADKPAVEEKLLSFHVALGYLDTFLATSKWTAGDRLTIADFTIAASVRTFHVADVDLSAYANVGRWYKQCEAELPYWSILEENSEGFRRYFAKLKK